MTAKYTNVNWQQDLIKYGEQTAIVFYSMETPLATTVLQLKEHAKLITAAPDLLDALQNLLLSYCDGFDYEDDELVIKARAAIAKAIGTPH